MADSIRGSIQDGHGEPQPFYGWLELSALLDDVRPRPVHDQLGGNGNDQESNAEVRDV